MIRSLKELLGYNVEEINTKKGTVKDFLFDKKFWIVRYLEIDLGFILPGEKLLVNKALFKTPDWEKKHFPIALTTDQLEKAPKLEDHLTFTREYEEVWNEYYGTPSYWDYGYIPPKARHFIDDTSSIEKKVHSHLGSFQEILKYEIYAMDGKIAHNTDLLVDDEHWEVKYFVVTVVNEKLLEKNYEVMLSTDWIDKIDYVDKKIYMNVNKEFIKNAPKFYPDDMVNEVYEKKLYDYYGRSHDYAL